MTIETKFVVTGQGRSGTKWLARLSDRATEYPVKHELLGQVDADFYGGIYDGSVDAKEYLGRRKSKMEERVDAEAVGEVNSYLRYCVPEIGEVYGCPVVGLIRDGRYTVRSMLWRSIWAKRKPPILPKDPSVQEMWPDLSPLGKCAWYWADCYERLADQDVPIFRLESLDGYFDALCEFGEAIGVRFTEPQWRRMSGRRVNSTHDQVRPLDWSRGEIKEFALLAGATQERFGYPVKDQR